MVINETVPFALKNPCYCCASVVNIRIVFLSQESTSEIDGMTYMTCVDPTSMITSSHSMTSISWCLALVPRRQTQLLKWWHPSKILWRMYNKYVLFAYVYDKCNICAKSQYEYDKWKKSSMYNRLVDVSFILRHCLICIDWGVVWGIMSWYNVPLLNIIRTTTCLNAFYIRVSWRTKQNVKVYVCLRVAILFFFKSAIVRLWLATTIHQLMIT